MIEHHNETSVRKKERVREKREKKKKECRTKKTLSAAPPPHRFPSMKIDSFFKGFLGLPLHCLLHLYRL